MEESCSAIISSSSAVQENSKHQEMLSFSVLNDDTGRTEAKKIVVLFPKIGWSLTHSHSRICIKIYIVNFKKETSNEKLEYKKSKKI